MCSFSKKFILQHVIVDKQLCVKYNSYEIHAIFIFALPQIIIHGCNSYFTRKGMLYT